jgi:uncharacterized protein with WD repeat
MFRLIFAKEVYDFFGFRTQLATHALDSNKGALAPVGANPQARLVLSETEKKIKTIHKKLDDIKKLKEKQANGEKLEANQLSKIDKESELISELANLEFK